MLTRCPRCGARLNGPSTRCDACGADLVPHLARSGANAASVLAPPSPAIASLDRQAPVAPPPDPTPDAPAGLSFDYTGLERPAISATLEDATWLPVLSTAIIIIIGAALGGYLVFKSGSVSGMVLGAFTIMLIVRAWLPAVRAAILRDRLLREGRRSLAVIYDRWSNKDDDGDPVYFVAYAFQREGSAQEAMIFRRAVKSAALYRRYAVGDVVPIRYLESNPHIAMVDALANPARS